MQELFRKIADLIANRQFESLALLTIPQPGKFNWARDIFEGIHVKDHPEAIALLWSDDSSTKRYSFKQITELSNQLLNFLRRHEVSQQDPLLTQMGLQPINWFTIMATIKGGFRMIPAATILSMQDIAYRFVKLMPRVVIADAANAPKIEEAEMLVGKEVTVKIIAEGQRPGWFSWEDIEKENTHADAAETNGLDPLFLFFTSGTTGMPKIVTHTHFSYPFGHLTTASWIGLKRGDVHYNISQPGWAKFAWSSFFAAWNVGATVFAYHQEGRFHAKNTLAMIERHKITTFCAPPTVLRLLILEDLPSYHFSFKECVAAGEPLNPEIIEIWKAGTGILIRDGYGQTESSCLVANLPDFELKFGSMGKPTFLYQVIIADESGVEMTPTIEGNICVKMNTGKPNGIFQGYYADPEKDKDVFKHGLYYTGDKAYCDEEGYIWFVGRDDDVIKSSDYRVGPFEVESILLEHEGVQESAVVGSPHAIKGFEIKAFIVLNDGFQPGIRLAEELFAFGKKNLAPYKMPRLLEFVTELPKTISGKIRRVELRAREAETKAKGIRNEQEYLYRS